MKVSDSLSPSLSFKRDIRQHLKRGDGGADHGDKHEGHVRETSPGHVRRSLGEETKWRPLEQHQKLVARALSISRAPGGFFLRPRPDYTPLLAARRIKSAVLPRLIANKIDVRVICA